MDRDDSIVSDLCFLRAFSFLFFFGSGYSFIGMKIERRGIVIVSAMRDELVIVYWKFMGNLFYGDM